MWLSYRFLLGYRDVEEQLAARVIASSTTSEPRHAIASAVGTV